MRRSEFELRQDYDPNGREVQVMAAVTIIKLTGENHRDIDAVASQIKTICDLSLIHI